MRHGSGQAEKVDLSQLKGLRAPSSLLTSPLSSLRAWSGCREGFAAFLQSRAWPRLCRLLSDAGPLEMSRPGEQPLSTYSLFWGLRATPRGRTVGILSRLWLEEGKGRYGCEFLPRDGIGGRWTRVGVYLYLKFCYFVHHRFFALIKNIFWFICHKIHP